MIRRSWRNARIALQLLAEERVGAPMRQEAAVKRAQEDAAAEAARSAVADAR